mgnify:CR=1 FL=1
MIPSAFRIIVPSMKQILGWAPTSLHNEVQEIMDRFMEKYNFKDYVTSVQVYGNTRIIEIDILVPKSFHIKPLLKLMLFAMKLTKKSAVTQRKNG